MVAGDLVNTASRDPGGRRAGHRARRRGDEARPPRPRSPTRTPAITSSRARRSRLQLWRALRVTAARGGAHARTGSRRRSSGATASCASSRSCSTPRRRSGKAHLVSVIGIAGIGKSRLAWEFDKYIDGLDRRTCGGTAAAASPTATGVAYWALAEMVRMRAADRRGRGAGVAARQAARVLESTSPTRRSGLGRAAARSPARARRARRADARTSSRPGASSSSGWPSTGPLALVFEDLQWADAGAARLHRPPARVVAQPPHLRARARAARSCSAARLGAGSRNAKTLALEPLSEAAMEQLLDGFVPGLPGRRCAGASSSAPKASRCTRSRRCGCCSTAACWPRGRASTGRPSRSRRSPSRRRSTRSSRPGSTALEPDRALARPGRGRARQDVHERASVALSGVRGGESSRC